MAAEPWVLGGVQYVTTSMACELLAGPREDYPSAAGYAAELQRWSDRIGWWIASPSVALDVVRDVRGAPVRMPAPGGRGRVNVLRWRDVVDAEWSVRLRGRGRGRAA